MKITRIGVGDGNDSIVIINDLGDISGGRTLDLTGFTGAVRAGHIIIKKANGDYAPLGVESGAYVDMSTGDEYAGVLKKSVTKGNSRAAIMTKGVVNAKALPYEVTDDIVGALEGICFEGYAGTGSTPTGPDYLCFTAEKAGSTLRMVGIVNENNTHTLPSLEYSTDDGETWNILIFTDGEVSDGAYSRVSDTLTFSNVGDKVLFRGNCPEGTAIGELVMNDPSVANGFMFSFNGGDNTVQDDNIFAVSGDLQTLVDGTGENKTAPCFGGLFAGVESLLITTAPDLTATQLTEYSYYSLFMFQTLLTAPAVMGNITNSSLSHIDLQTGEGGYAFLYMYVTTGITTMPSLPNIVLDQNGTTQDLYNVFLNVLRIVYDTQALITSDNGRTLNGLSGIDISDEAIAHYAEFLGPITQADIAAIIGSLNGFVCAKIVVESNNHNHGEVSCNPELVDGDFVTDGLNFWIKDGVSEQATLTATPHGGYSFVKWLTSSDNGETWTDDTEHLTDTITFDAVPDGEYYYKAVFEAESYSKVNVGYFPNECDITFTDGTDNVRTLEYGQDEDFPRDIYSSAELVKQGLFVKQGDSITFGLECSPKQGYEFVKWMELDNGEWIQLDTAQTIYQSYGSPNDILVNLKAICQPKSDSSISSSDISANSNTPEIIGG